MPTVQIGYQPAARKVYDSALTGAQASIAIPIPAGGRNIRIALRARTDSTSGNDTYVLMRPNADATAADYNTIFQNSTDTVAPASGGMLGTQAGAYIGSAPSANAPAGELGQFDAVIDGYGDASNHKSWRCAAFHAATSTAGGLWIQFTSGTWLSSAAITSLTLVPAAGNFVAGTSVQVYVDQ